MHRIQKFWRQSYNGYKTTRIHFGINSSFAETCNLYHHNNISAEELSITQSRVELIHKSEHTMSQNGQNGILSSMDITREIISHVITDPQDDRRDQEKDFVVVRAVCTLWKSFADQVFSFSDPTMLLRSMSLGRRLAVSFLVKKTQLENHILVDTVRKGLLMGVELILKESTVDPSVDQNEAFRMACKHGHLEIVKV